MEPPSKSLVELLVGLNLCTPGDLKRCRGRVKRLARDLPAFDSIWIDALVQARKLSPFQARLLESDHPERLRVGRCLLIDQLGQSPRAATYLARRRDGRERCVLKLIDHPPESIEAGLARLEELVSRGNGFAHPSVIVPHACLSLDGQLVTVSRFLPGPNLHELLIRRGRFPAAIVFEIARQLVDGLAALESRGGVHGDIRLCNVRLTSAGVAVLVDGGIGPAVSPELTIHTELTPDRCDCIAPELIGTGQSPSPASDVYALGCLLWQLLAGRPPFPTGDPLAKLAAHQTREISDVREWAPDTPAPLAEAIRAFTARDAQQRPQSFAEVREWWGPPRRSGRRRLARFHALFNTSAPRIATGAGSSSAQPWVWSVALLFVVSGAVLTLVDQGARNQLLTILSGISGTTSRSVDLDPREQTSNTPETPSQQLLPMPGPDAEGVILLTAAGPYEAAEISAVGALTIRGTADLHPEIIVRDRPMHVWAERLTLENVGFVKEEADRSADVRPSKASGALLLVQSQTLTIQGCSFRRDVDFNPREDGFAPDENQLNGNPIAARTGRAAERVDYNIAVAWKVIDSNDRSGGLVSLRDSVFCGGGSALFLSSVPRELQAANCLKLGEGALFTLSAIPQPERELRITLEHVTLRQASGLLRLNLAKTRAGQRAGKINVDANDCVFDLAGPRAALFAFVAQQVSTETLAAVEMTGEGSLAGPELAVAALLDPLDGSPTVLPVNAVALEGLVAGPFQFAGPWDLSDSRPSHSTIEDHGGPRRSATPPGIEATKLPAFRLE